MGRYFVLVYDVLWLVAPVVGRWALPSVLSIVVVLTLSKGLEFAAFSLNVASMFAEVASSGFFVLRIGTVRIFLSG